MESTVTIPLKEYEELKQIKENKKGFVLERHLYDQEVSYEFFDKDELVEYLTNDLKAQRDVIEYIRKERNDYKEMVDTIKICLLGVNKRNIIKSIHKVVD